MLFTYDCSPRQLGNCIVKFADDTVVVGLVSHNDESSYRQEVKDLLDWCEENNRCISVRETKRSWSWTLGGEAMPPHPFLLVV